MDLFIAEYGRLLIFFHVISAMIWVGGMIVIRVAVHPSLQKISDPKSRIPRTLEVMKRLFFFVLAFVFLLMLTGTLLVLGYGFSENAPELSVIAHVKETILLVMFANLIAMMIKRKKAERAFYLGDDQIMAKHLGHISKVMIPVNIFLGLVALYFGIVLRGV